MTLEGTLMPITVSARFVHVGRFVPALVSPPMDVSWDVGAAGGPRHVIAARERFQQHKESSKNSNALKSCTSRRHQKCTHSRTSTAC